ncbi:hypothetical protein HK097_006448, partial [Rhizophlyctis rosea]
AKGFKRSLENVVTSKHLEERLEHAAESAKSEIKDALRNVVKKDGFSSLLKQHGASVAGEQSQSTAVPNSKRFLEDNREYLSSLIDDQINAGAGKGVILTKNEVMNWIRQQVNEAVRRLEEDAKSAGEKFTSELEGVKGHVDDVRKHVKDHVKDVTENVKERVAEHRSLKEVVHGLEEKVKDAWKGVGSHHEKPVEKADATSAPPVQQPHKPQQQQPPVSLFNVTESQLTDVHVAQIVQKMIDDALEKYRADRLARPDYALESGGARVLEDLTSPTFQLEFSSTAVRWFGRIMGAKKPRGKPAKTALQPDVQPGQCWAMEGECLPHIVTSSVFVY